MYKIPANTHFLGKNLVFVPECHSTNTLALQCCRQPGVVEGTVVITHHQTAGRGQRGNTWESEPGLNLTFSIILQPTFLSPARQFDLNRSVSLGLYDFLAEILKDRVKIKWPNDMVASGKKVCGMLIENVMQGPEIHFSVVGIGLNVNQVHFSSARASSLQLLTGKEYALSDTLEKVLSKIEDRYRMLRQNPQALMNDYHAALLGLGEQQKFRVGEKEMNGMITGVDETGKLKMATAEGEKTFDTKEIEFIY